MKNLLLVLVVGVLGGCAFISDSIDLQYTQQANVYKLKNAENIHVSVEVKDDRTDKTKVSAKKDGYGVELAPILANQRVDVTIKNSIETELKSRGFQLSDDPFVRIKASVSQFYNDHKPGFLTGDAVSNFDLLVNVFDRPGNQIFTKLIKAQGTEPNIVLTSGENARLSLNNALNNGIHELFNDDSFVNILLNPSKSSTSISPVPDKPKKLIEVDSSDISTQLKKLKELKDSGILTNEEYEVRRKVLVDKL